MQHTNNSPRHRPLAVPRSRRSVNRWRLQAAGNHSFSHGVTLLLTMAVAAAGLIAPEPLCAEGREHTLRGSDLIVQLDTRWAGGMQGGYYPVRIRVTNRGVPRTLTFRISSDIGHFPVVERTVSLAQNASARFTLPVPLVGDESFAQFNVYHQGRVVKDLETQLSFTEIGYSDSDRPALLVITPELVDCEEFEAAINSIISGTTTTSSYGYGIYGHSSYTVENHNVIPPSSVPDSWIDYTSIDLVAVPLNVLEQLSDAQRSAILKWVHGGGTLMVYEVGSAAEESRRLNELLQLSQHRFVSPEWSLCDPGARQVITHIEPSSPSNGFVIEETIDEEDEEDAEEQEQESVAFAWNEEAFAHRDLMLGRVYAFPENPFPGTIHDWHWLLESVGEQRCRWHQRYGFSSRSSNSEFMHFLISSVQGVPARAFLVLITLFGIVIGPLNYLWLRRRNQLSLLVVTIPAIAVLTSSSLFAYSAIAHGFGIKSRVRSVTVLDQKSRTAVGLNRLSLYAGLAPSAGLRFSPETAVFPIWPSSQTFESGRIDWSDGQQLQGGWFRSRTRTQFVTHTHRVERGRLEIGEPRNGTLPVSNGLECELLHVVVRADDGNLYTGRQLSAGASAELSAATPEELKTLEELFQAHRLREPGSERGRNNSTGMFGWTSYGYRTGLNTVYSQSRQERIIEILSQLHSSSEALQPESYLAICRDNPAVERGVETSTDEESFHVLLGYY